MRVVGVQVGRAKHYGNPEAQTPEQSPWHSGFVKSAVNGTVWIHQFGPAGDEQADLKHHGGPDKAVLGYAVSNYDAWLADLGKRLPNGGFGENLTFDGLSERDVCIGDQYAIGDLILEVSQTRIPCWKISRRWDQADLLQRVRDTGRTGWYFRVIREGGVSAGDAVHRVARPAPEWTIARVNDILHRRETGQQHLAALAALPWLAESQREILANRLKQA